MPTERAPATTTSRGGLVGDLLVELVRDAAMRSAAPVRVLDCGGGSGTFAVPLAAAGAEVTVVDISVDALATLRRRAFEAGVPDRVRALQGDIETVSDTTGAERFDLVLAHDVLAAVESVDAALAAIGSAVVPGGLVSLLVTNPVAAVLGRALAGDLSGAERELDADAAQRGPSPERVEELCGVHGLVVEQRHGVGVFRDLVPGHALDQPGAREALARLELACSTRTPFADIAGRIHLLARLPMGR